jgi:uncharacterized protein YdhG (YjbR/CyaY superfamily)
MDEYLAGVPEPARSRLREVRATVRSVVPAEAAECISYQMPTFKYKASPAIYFAAFAKHCSLFPASLAVIAKFKEELKGFDISKGTIRFPVDKPFPPALLKKMVKARLAEIERKKPRS